MSSKRNIFLFPNKVITTIFLVASVYFAQQANASLISESQEGQPILLIRHADAPGYGDPAGYNLAQCSTQRNLGDYGKKQARAIGDWLSKQGIKNAQVFSSPWCRCLDTAQLLNQGPVKVDSALGSFFDDMSLEKRQTKELESLIKRELDKNHRAPIIMVTHHVNIEAFTGKAVAVGDIVLVRVNKNGQYRSHILYPSPKPS
jgi:phosphohistidine phosphatase SixA